MFIACRSRNQVRLVQFAEATIIPFARWPKAPDFFLNRFLTASGDSRMHAKAAQP